MRWRFKIQKWINENHGKLTEHSDIKPQEVKTNCWRAFIREIKAIVGRKKKYERYWIKTKQWTSNFQITTPSSEGVTR